MRLANRMFSTALWILVLFAAAILPAEAKEDVCKADAEKFCKGIEPGEGRILKCLNEHESELSPACRETVSSWMQKVSEGGEAVLPACKPDAARLCQGVAPGQGRIATCLKEHEAELSQECKEAVSAKLQKAKESAEVLGPACRQFVDRFCRDVTPGQGRIAVCLKAHASELSPECRVALAGERQSGQPSGGAGQEDKSLVEQGQGVGVELQVEQEKEAQPVGGGVLQRKPEKAEKKR